MQSGFDSTVSSYITLFESSFVSETEVEAKYKQKKTITRNARGRCEKVKRQAESFRFELTVKLVSKTANVIFIKIFRI